MGKAEIVPSPRVMIFSGHALQAPWVDIAREGMFQTWLREPEPYGLQVRHMHGMTMPVGTRWLDRWHEWARWQVRGKHIVPALDATLSWPLRQALPGYCERPRFLGTEHIAWHVHVPDSYFSLRWKMVAGYQALLNECDFDLVYMATTSSYVHIPRLLELVQDFPTSGVYAGSTIYDVRSGTWFASGANRMMSRDVLELIVANRDRYTSRHPEDLDLGRMLAGLGVQVRELPTMNIASLEALDALSDEDLQASHHFRLTSGSRRNRGDVPLMHALHARLNSA